jgi:hypothetical protein
MYRFIVSIILILVLVLTLDCCGVAASDTVWIPKDSFSSPYPGLGFDAVTGESYVIPGGTTNTGLPSALPARTLLSEPSDDEIFRSTFTSTPKTTGELYLSRIPNGKRSGVFQKANFNALWAPNSGGRKGLGLTQLDISAMFALPLPTPDSPLVITPSFQSTFFDPKISNYATNKTLYKTGLDFRWIRPIVKNKWTLDLGVGTYYSGDFRVKGSKALRFPAHIASVWDCNPRLKVILGVVYLDQKGDDDYNWLPMVGLIWTPHEDNSIELVIPRIRFAERVRWFGSAAGDETSDWIYAAFEFGGGSWGYEYQGYQNVSGNINYRDLKLLLGYERRCASGVTLGFEIGYMFERKYEFDHFGYSTHPADCVFLRIRTSF